MKTMTLSSWVSSSLLLLGVHVYGQTIPGEPTCASACLARAFGTAGCNLSDLGCRCSDDTKAAVLILGGPCLLGSCYASDLGVLSSVGLAACSSYSAGLLPSLTVPANASAARVTGAAAAAAATPTGGPASPGEPPPSRNASTSHSPLEQLESFFPFLSHGNGDSSTTPTTGRDSPGISTAAKVSIAVGVMVLVSFVGVGVTCFAVFVRRRRRRRRCAARGADGERALEKAPVQDLAEWVRMHAEHDLDEKGNRRRFTAVDLTEKSGGPQELHNDPVSVYVYELPGTGIRVGKSDA